jgi:two-component system, OmpR family, response regulator
VNRHIALVEDDEVILGNYADFLSGLGFEVDRYGSKLAALEGLLKRPPELVLLDISLNGERDAGFAICAELRRRSRRLPVIFLSSYGADVDKISGLRLDADDYITKDVSFDYLVVRIEALFRRIDAYAAPTGPAGPNSSPISSVEVDFDAQRSVARWRGQTLDLTLTHFWILQDLCRIPGRTRSVAELMKAAKLTVAPNTMAAHVKAIRDAFLHVDSSFDRIRTERGRGYRWVPS